MIPMRRGRTLLPCVLLLFGGCHVWRRSADVLAQPLGPRFRVQLWSRGHAQLVHAVRVRGDSVIAVPYWFPPNCDSCAIRLPLAQVDSVRIKEPAEVRTIVLTAFLVGLGTALIAFISALSEYSKT